MTDNIYSVADKIAVNEGLEAALEFINGLEEHNGDLHLQRSEAW